MDYYVLKGKSLTSKSKQHKFVSTVFVSACDLTDEDKMLMVGAKCSRENQNSAISTLYAHKNTDNYIWKIHKNKQVYQTFN